MATPKSANERIRRKLRRKKITPSGIDLTGRVVSKKPANNDPDRKHRIAREFVEFYKTGINPKVEYKQIIEDLLSLAIENAGKIELPYTIDRLEYLNECCSHSSDDGLYNEMVEKINYINDNININDYDKNSMKNVIKSIDDFINNSIK